VNEKQKVLATTNNRTVPRAYTRLAIPAVTLDVAFHHVFTLQVTTTRTAALRWQSFFVARYRHRHDRLDLHVVRNYLNTDFVQLFSLALNVPGI